MPDALTDTVMTGWRPVGDQLATVGDQLATVGDRWRPVGDLLATLDLMCKKIYCKEMLEMTP